MSRGQRVLLVAVSFLLLAISILALLSDEMYGSLMIFLASVAGFYVTLRPSAKKSDDDGKLPADSLAIAPIYYMLEQQAPFDDLKTLKSEDPRMSGLSIWVAMYKIFLFNSYFASKFQMRAPSQS